MPISPDQACKILTDAEGLAYETITQHIDKKLEELYQGSGTVKIEFYRESGYTDRVRTRMFQEYGKAGWGEVQISHPDYYKSMLKPEGPMWIELTKEKQPLRDDGYGT